MCIRDRYLSIDEDVARYVDIARGHHKFYNGKGGYPNDFDNTASPERFMIDIDVYKRQGVYDGAEAAAAE